MGFDKRELRRFLREPVAALTDPHAIVLCNRHSIPWELCSGWSGPSWTGDHFVFEYDYSDEIDSENMLHEVLHYAVASSWQRRMPDFGLGANGIPGRWFSSEWLVPPQQRSNSVHGYRPSWSNERRVSRRVAAHQEMVTSIGVSLLVLLKRGYKVSRAIDTLEDFGLLDRPKEGMPTWNARTSRQAAARLAPFCGLEVDRVHQHFEKLRNTIKHRAL